MTSQLEKITDLLLPAIQGLGFELLGCRLIGSSKQRCLRVYIDKPGGVSIEDCSVATRQVAALLDVEDILSSAYRLEVSSPGLDRPLFSVSHYKAALGKRVRLHLYKKSAERQNYTGQLQSVEGSTLGILVDGEVVYIAYNDIREGHVVAEIR